MGVVMAQGARLFHGFFRTGDDELIFDRLNPESRWKISEVGDDGDKRPAGINLGPAFTNLPVKMRNYGDEQVRRLFAPELFKKIHERPAFLQHDVVLLLNADAGEFAQDVQAVC